jgi:predicted PurR-regulated permease PerM
MATRTRTTTLLRLPNLTKVGGALLAVLLVYRFFPVLAHVALILYAAVIVAVAINTIVQRLPLQRRWVVVLLGFGLLALTTLAVVLGGPLLLEQLREISERAPEFEARLQLLSQQVRQTTGINLGPLDQHLNRALQGLFAQGDMIGQARGLIGFVLLPLLVLFGGMFAVASPNDRLLVPLLRAIPRERRNQVRRVFDLLGERLSAWIVGQLIAMLAVGTLATIVLTLLGVPYSLLLGILNGFTEFIPIAGPWMGGVPAVAIAALEEPTKGIWTALAMFGIQLAEANLIMPLAMSKVANVHPFVTLFALFVFGSLFGFLGMLLALPLVLLIWTVVQVFWVEGTIDTDRDRIAPVVEE